MSQARNKTVEALRHLADRIEAGEHTIRGAEIKVERVDSNLIVTSITIERDIQNEVIVDFTDQNVEAWVTTQIPTKEET